MPSKDIHQVFIHREINMKNLVKTKTFWAGMAGLVAAVGGAVTGDVSTAQAVQTGIVSLMGIFLRDGMLKAG